MRRHLPAAVLALPVLGLLWYLPALGELFASRYYKEGGSATDALGNAFTGGVPSETIDVRQLIEDHVNWRPYAIAAFCAAALVFGLALAARRFSPVLGLVAGVPLIVVETVVAFRPKARDVAGDLPNFAGAAGHEGTTELGAQTFLGGGYLLIGVALVASSLLASRMKAVPGWRGVLLGVAVFALGWVAYFEGMAGGPVLHLALIAVAAILFGVVATAPRLTRWAAVVCGLPAVALGLCALFDSDSYFWIIARIIPLSLTYSNDHFFELRSVVADTTYLYLVIGGGLLAAAAPPRRRPARSAH